MLDALLLPIFVILTIFLTYFWIKRKLYYFKIRHIPSLKPSLFLGYRVEILLKRCTPQDIVLKLYNRFPDARVIGFYKFLTPTYLIRDPELLKQITVTSFDHFQDHVPHMDDGMDDLFSNGLLFLNGQKWRDMRATLSPAFTSSRMRQMLHFVSECAVNMTQHVQSKLDAGKCVNIEMKELLSRCINDVISSIAFGVHVDSFKNDQNEVFLNSQRFLKFNVFKFVFLAIMPMKLVKSLGINITPSGVSKFFRFLLMDTMEVREKNNIFRPDMINIMMGMRKGNVQMGGGKSKERDTNDGFAAVEETQNGRRIVNRTWTDNELMAQCFIFYIAGLDTSSVASAALAFEMAVNPDLQQKLYKEISDANEQLGGNPLDYDALQKLKYLDQVVRETLRKWPPLPKTDRICIKDFHFNDGITQLNIEKGVAITVPIHPIHHDPKYFPNPDVFDPDRFSDENKRNIIHGTYIPFGFGPRSCIASRFALMQIKVIAYHLLLNFELVPNGETQIPLKFKKQLFWIGFEKGVQIELRPRQK